MYNIFKTSRSAVRFLNNSIIGRCKLFSDKCQVVNNDNWLKIAFPDVVEEAINRQVSVEYKAGMVYRSMANYFNRHDVALTGFYKRFLRHYREEFNHADGLLEFLQKRGGKPELFDIVRPSNEWDGVEHIVKSALDLENNNYDALYKINELAQEHKDVSTSEFLESVYLTEQLEDQKDLADLLTKVRYAIESKTIHLLDYNVGKIEAKEFKK